MRTSVRRRHGTVWPAAACLVGSLLSTPMVAVAATPAVAVTTPAAAVSGEKSALAAAAASGEPVEVVEQRGEFSTVFANPDGTMRADVSNVAVRVRRGSAWVPIDTTLERRSDGTVAPRAASVSMEFSAGGSAPLVRLRRGGGSVDLVAPFKLPIPALAGDTATYAEVLPGVDLVVTAGADTVYERFVVKSAAAAANPELMSLRFGTRTVGLTLQNHEGGGIDAVNDRGDVVLTGPAPIMWDSAGTSAPDQASGSAGSAADARSGAAPSDTDAGAPQNSEQPAEGNTVAPVGLSLDAEGLTLRPDLEVLRGPRTTYPVYLDPQLGGVRTGWAMVNKTYPDQAYWKWAGDSDGAEGLGHINDPLQGVHTKRLFFQYATSAFTGKVIDSATLRVFGTHADSCVASTVQAWHVRGISSATTWTKQPAHATLTDSDLQDSRTVAFGRPDCTPGGAELAFDVTAALEYQGRHRAATTTIKLQAADEESNAGWKRFRKDASLTVVYNTRPSRPSAMKMTSPAGACPAAAKPFPNDPPQLAATFGDVDAGDTLTGNFELYNAAGMLLKEYAPTAASAANLTQTWDLASPAAYPLPEGLPDGAYKWRARGQDAAGLFGAWTGWCTFSIDTKAPAEPTLTADPATSAATPENPFPFGGTSTFTVTFTDPSTQSYTWSLDSSVATSAAIASTSPTFTVPMQVSGPVTVRVWAYDAAGNVSSPAIFEVMVGRAAVAPDTVGVTATTPNRAKPADVVR